MSEALHGSDIAREAGMTVETTAANDPLVLTIMKKAPFTFKTVLRHYAKWVLTRGQVG